MCKDCKTFKEYRAAHPEVPEMSYEEYKKREHEGTIREQGEDYVIFQIGEDVWIIELPPWPK